MMSQGKDIATKIKDSMVLWYDIERMLDGKLETYALSYADKFGIFDGNEIELYDSYLHITKLGYTSNSYKFGITDPGGAVTDIPAHEITITGMPEGLVFQLMGDGRPNTVEGYNDVNFDITQDGTYQIPRLCNTEGPGMGSLYLYMFKADIPEGTELECDITITQTPISTTDPNTYMSSNPTLVDLSGNGHDATCNGFVWNISSGIANSSSGWVLRANGVDNYCLVTNLPLLTADKGFTVITKRDFTLSTDKVYTAFASKQTDATETIGAFTIERTSNDAEMGSRMSINSFGMNNNITASNKGGTMYCTADKYANTNTLVQGDHADSNSLVLFKFDCSTNIQYCGQGVLYSFLLFNRNLSQSEINWVLTNLINGDYKFE